MPTYTALTTLPGKEPAEALGLAMERLDPEPTGVGVFEIEDGSGLWEVGGYFTEAPDRAGLPADWIADWRARGPQDGSLVRLSRCGCG